MADHEAAWAKGLAQEQAHQKAGTWTDSTTGAEALAATQPLIAALNSVQPQLAAIAAVYPPAAASLQASLAGARRISSDLVNLGRLESIGLSAWQRAFTTDIARLVAVSKQLRRDLGLPPISG